MLATIEEIAQDVAGQMMPLDLEDIATGFQSHSYLERMWMKTSMMREIRNDYSLWYDNPLTERWRTDKSSHDIRGGVDFSEDHPDNVSLVIYKRIEEIAKARLTQG